MNSSIPPINLTQLASMLAEDKLVGGIMKDIPIDLSALKVSQNFSMQIVIDNELLMTQSPFEAVLKLDEGQTIPLKLSLEKPVFIPEKARGELEAKVVANSGGELKFKLVSIDGETPEKFVIADKSEISKNLASKISENFSKNIKTESAPIIKNISNLQEKAEVVSGIKLDKVFDAVKTQVLETSKGTSLQANTELSKFAASETPKNLLKELSQFELKFAVKDISPVPEKVQQIVSENKPEILTKLENLLEKNVAKVTELVADKSTLSKDILLALPKAKEELVLLKETPILAKVEQVLKNDSFILKTDLGNLLLKSDLKLPLGKEVLLNVADIIYNQPKSVENLNPFDKILKLVTPKFEHLIAPKIPNFNTPKAVENLLSYVKSVSQQDLKVWLGQETIETLSRSGVEGRESLLNLNNLISGNVKETPTWRFVEVPFMLDSGFSKFKIAIKKDNEEQSKQKKKSKGGSRFLIDTEFSMLGAIQFDGYAVEKEKRFDLILRTEKEFLDDIYSNIVKLFKITLNELNYSGNIKINAKQEFVKISEEEMVLYDDLYV